MVLNEDVINIINSYLFGYCDCCNKKKYYYNLFNYCIIFIKNNNIKYDLICILCINKYNQRYKILHLI